MQSKFSAVSRWSIMVFYSVTCKGMCAAWKESIKKNGPGPLWFEIMLTALEANKCWKNCVYNYISIVV